MSNIYNDPSLSPCNQSGEEKSSFLREREDDFSNEGWVKLYRRFYKGDIANKPPHFRELFIWLVVHANHKPGRSSGRTIERGQLFTSYTDIQGALHWYVGARKELYKKHKIESAMKWLRKEGMIRTTKTTCGMIITICRYNDYQHGLFSEQTPKPTLKPSMNRHTSHTINKNERIKESDISSELPKISFEIFWHAYGKEVGPKPKIKRLWDQLKVSEQEAVMEYIPDYKAARPEKEFRKNPENFLNDRAWEDELIGHGAARPRSPGPQEGTRLKDYEIPNDDLFGYSKEELQKRIETGKYPKT